MYTTTYSATGLPYHLPLFIGGFLLGFVILIAWSLVWKGMALWKAARRGDKGWFIAMLIIHTAGILEILYLYVFSRNTAAPTVPKEDTTV